MKSPGTAVPRTAVPRTAVRLTPRASTCRSRRPSRTHPTTSPSIRLQLLHRRPVVCTAAHTSPPRHWTRPAPDRAARRSARHQQHGRNTAGRLRSAGRKPWWKYLRPARPVRRRKKLRHARHRCRQRSTSGERRPARPTPAISLTSNVGPTHRAGDASRLWSEFAVDPRHSGRSQRGIVLRRAAVPQRAGRPDVLLPPRRRPDCRPRLRAYGKRTALTDRQKVQLLALPQIGVLRSWGRCRVPYRRVRHR